MADPFTGIAAVATAASIIQIIQVGLQVGNRILKFLSQQTDELPKNLKAAHERLGLWVMSLEQMELAKYDEEDPRMKTFLVGVVNRIVELNNTLTKYLPVEDDSRMMRLGKALTSIGKDSKVSEICAQIHDDANQLNAFLLSRQTLGLSQGLSVSEVARLKGRRFLKFHIGRYPYLLGGKTF